MKPDFDFILCSHASNFKEQKGAISLKLHHEYNKCKKRRQHHSFINCENHGTYYLLEPEWSSGYNTYSGKKMVKVLKEILCEFDRLDNNNSNQKHLKSQRLVIYFWSISRSLFIKRLTSSAWLKVVFKKRYIMWFTAKTRGKSEYLQCWCSFMSNGELVWCLHGAT